MEYLELSIEDVKEKNKELYHLIKNNYNYDLVIFIAKGSYLIGKDLAELNNCDLLEIFATRTGGKLKKIIKPFFKFVPKILLIKLRKKEMNSNFHNKNSDRKVSFDKQLYSKYKNVNNILLVDDSIVSGHSIVLTKKILVEYFINANVKIAVFNKMKKALIDANYYLYEDTMICGPWSNDSKYNKEYSKMYDNWKKGV